MGRSQIAGQRIKEREEERRCKERENAAKMEWLHHKQKPGDMFKGQHEGQLSKLLLDLPIFSPVAHPPPTMPGVSQVWSLSGSFFPMKYLLSFPGRGESINSLYSHSTNLCFQLRAISSLSIVPDNIILKLIWSFGSLNKACFLLIYSSKSIRSYNFLLLGLLSSFHNYIS